MKAGDTIICIDATGVDYLRKGQRYTAVYVYGAFVDIGIVAGHLTGFYQRRFRRVPQTDISVLTALLVQRELAPH